MAEANDPSSSTSAPQHADAAASPPPSPAGAPAEEAGPRLPLPPLASSPKVQTSPEQLAAEIARLDRALVAMVLALAFLLASIPVRNSDFWMHLGTGRLLAQGQYQFGVDPFSYTSTAYWANHAWLYDLILYGLVRAAGGPESETAGVVVVVIKALLVTLLAWVMLQTRRPERSLWIPAVCTALALFASSLRLLLQPTLISLLFLSLTLYVLQRPRHVEPDGRPPAQERRSPLAIYWLLVPLFVLWVNMDSWFLLGPITVALYLLGQSLQQLLAPVRTGADAPEPRQLRVLAMVLVAGTAACLLNPHHYHAFALPAVLPLTASADVLEREELFRQLFYGLFQDDYWQSRAAWTPASLALWPLLVLGLASFACTLFTGWRWWRITLWLAFLLLGVYQVRALPFFAVVAAAITALNWQDVLASRFGTGPRLDPLWKAWSLGGRLLTLLLVVAVLAGTWSGWLYLSWYNGVPTSGPGGRRVAWAIDIDPSLRKTVEQLRSWRQEGLLRPDEHGFGYAPEVVNYCAWFCPEEKGFFDYRFDLFSPELATAFVDIRQSLRGNPPPAGDSARSRVDWQEIFRRYHINHVVLHGSDSSPLNPGMYNSLQAMIWMLFDPEHWTLLYLDGRSSIFRWNDSASEDGAARPRIARFDPNRLAFGPEPERAPPTHAEQAPPLPDLAAHWLHRPPQAPLDSDLAARYIGYFNQVRQQWPFPALVGTEFANWASTVGLSAVNPCTVTIPATLAFHTWPDFLAFNSPRALEYFLRDKPYGPAAAPVLAVRAARRAIAESPGYAESYFALAEAYATLWREQEEHWVGQSYTSRDFLPRQKLRQVQLLTALEYYLMLRPQDGEAHWRLFQSYAQLQYLDLALDHLRWATEYFASRGPGRGESREEFQRRIEQLRQEVTKRAADVKSREDDYEVDTRDKPLSGKVQKALQNSLIKRARDLLLEADPVQLGPGEINYLFDLLLSTGRPDLAFAYSSEVLRPALGLDYEWYNVLISAACGDYRRAGQFLEEYILRIEQANVEGAIRLLEMQTFQGGLSPGLSPRSLYGVLMTSNGIRQIADWRVLRGMLAVEEGDNAVAAKSFQAALDMGDRESFAFESRPIALQYLQRIREAGGVR
jgi:hypothetical protein